MNPFNRTYHVHLDDDERRIMREVSMRDRTDDNDLILGLFDDVAYYRAQLHAVRTSPKLSALAIEIVRWGRVTFPNAAAEGGLRHMAREVAEAIERMEQYKQATLEKRGRDSASAWAELGEELADIFHLLVQVADRMQIDLADQVERKLRKNMERQWPSVPDAQGVFEHVRTEGGGVTG